MSIQQSNTEPGRPSYGEQFVDHQAKKLHANQGPIMEMVEKLGNQVGAYHQIVTDLEKTLQPVTAPSESVVGDPNAPIDDGGWPQLAKMLHGISRDLNSANARLRELGSQVDI